MEQPPRGRAHRDARRTTSSRSPSRTRAASSAASLITLLYMTQIAAISQDPWFSRVQSPLDADYVALDLDPGRRHAVRARARRRALDPRRAGVAAACRPCRRRRARAACTSTSRCRRARRTSRACCSARSSRPSIAARHPKVATVERTVTRAAARHGLRRLPAEHPRQDAGDRLQRARQRVRRRLDAARLGGDRRAARSARLHDRHGAGAIRARSAICGRGCGQRSPATLEAVFRKYAEMTGSAHASSAAARLTAVSRPGPSNQPRERRLVVARADLRDSGMDLDRAAQVVRAASRRTPRRRSRCRRAAPPRRRTACRRA